ncbi:MAG TPA: gliding motility-associated C-terminal domain-containing protein, partial [Flavobacteriales bacterium]|nr:gliding motility-associated C-terminal domain-containing protein [Flavobacteriales bacterium]
GPQPVTVSSPPAFTASPVVTDVLCNGLCNGSITINAVGGSGSFLFSIDGGVSFQASNTFINLCPGAYVVMVQDGTGCSSTPVTVNVNEPTVLDATTSNLDADCSASNGAATVFPFGGTPGYTVSWTDFMLNPLGQTTLTAIGLSAGIYIATITDANGCQFQQSVAVGNFPAPSATAVFTNPVCNGDCNGAVDITTTGGVAPYSYTWFPTGQTTEDITNVCAGLQTVQITDALGCIAFNSFDLTEPAPFVDNTTVTDATCGLMNGSATSIVTGGTGALTLTWSNLQTGSTATGLAAGAYSVLVTDAAGCSDQFNVIVNNTTGPSPVVNVTNPTCFNNCSGSATVSAIGGTAPYTYLWVTNGSTSTTVNNLCPGTIIVEVQDSLGCVGIANVNITSSPAMNDSIVVQPATCGVCDGTAVIFSSGLTPFTYQWSAAAGSATTPSILNMCAGLYSAVVTDANGCTDTVLAAIPNANAPTLSVTTTDPSCYGICDGTATATGTGGTGTLTINWYDNVPTSISTSVTSINALCDGDYVAEVVDSLGCLSFMPFTIDEADSLVASINFTMDESCFNTCDGIVSAMPINGTLPFTYTWGPPAGVTTSAATNLCDGVYTVTVADANGCSLTLTDTITEPPAIFMSLDSINASCSTVPDGSVDATVTGGAGGFTYSWTGPNGFTAFTEDITNIYYGTYVLTVTDSNGCSLTDSIYVDALLFANAAAGNDTVLCGVTGGAVLTGIGTSGASYTWTDTAGNILSTTVLLTLPSTSGTVDYIFTVNNSGCIDSDTVSVTVNPLPPADAGPDYQIILGQSVVIGGNPSTASGNTVNWLPVNFLDDASSFNPTATPDSSTYYVLTVTDANGCVNTDTMLVEVFPDIIFPNGFSPNGDGANDTWILDFIEMFPDCEVSVYNRWGQPVFYSKGYDIPWDGTYSSKPVTVGTYYYVILLNHPLYPDAFTGPLTILR